MSSIQQWGSAVVTASQGVSHSHSEAQGPQATQGLHWSWHVVTFTGPSWRSLQTLQVVRQLKGMPGWKETTGKGSMGMLPAPRDRWERHPPAPLKTSFLRGCLWTLLIGSRHSRQALETETCCRAERYQGSPYHLLTMGSPTKLWVWPSWTQACCLQGALLRALQWEVSVNSIA